MKVRALRLGYYGHERRREGAVFELKPKKVKGKDGKEAIIPAEAQFSEAWMEKVEGSQGRKPKAKDEPAVPDEDEHVI